jgi:hypothetical protein
LTINLDEVLNHRAVSELYEKLQRKGITKEASREDWIKRLLQNYRDKFKASDPSETVKFNVKNNLVWKNGQIDFNDSIYHEFFIPYDYVPGHDADNERPLLTPKIHVGLSVRLFLVNGILKLQIGDFSKDVSPDVTREGLAVYKTHETITSFPLMYFSHRLRLPENYLNLSMYATEAYYQHQKDIKGDFTKDWKEICKDVADYNYVCSVADEYVEDRSKWEKIEARFQEKRDAWLKREEFRSPFERNDDDYDYLDMRDNSIHSFSKYLSVFATNFSNSRENRERYAYTDYYEERP